MITKYIGTSFPFFRHVLITLLRINHVMCVLIKKIYSNYIADFVLTFAVPCILPELSFGQYSVGDVEIIKHGDEVPK